MIVHNIFSLILPVLFYNKTTREIINHFFAPKDTVKYISIKIDTKYFYLKTSIDKPNIDLLMILMIYKIVFTLQIIPLGFSGSLIYQTIK